MRIIRSEDPDFNNSWSDLICYGEFDHPLYNKVNREFYRALRPNCQFRDFSFTISTDQAILCGAQLGLSHFPEGHKEISGYGLPFLIIDNKKNETQAFRHGHKLLKKELDRIIVTTGADTVIYQDYLLNSQLSVPGKFLMNKGASATPFFTQIINLFETPENLFKNVRKSYKSLINWGKRHLETRIIDHQSVTEEQIEIFRKLHFKAAGRETRSRKSWDIQYRMILDKEAFAIIGKLEGELVSAALFPCSKTYCFYGVSASNRELFDKPLSHIIIWQAMLHAKEKGCQLFELPEQLYPNQGEQPPDQKELNISKFKHGFGGETQVRLNIILNL